MEVSADFNISTVWFENLPQDEFDNLKATLEIFKLEEFKRIWDEGQLSLRAKFKYSEDFEDFLNIIQWNNLVPSEINKEYRVFN